MRKKVGHLLGTILMISMCFAWQTTVQAAETVASGELSCTSGNVNWNIGDNGVLTYSGRGVLDAYETLTSFDLGSFHLKKEDIKEVSTAGADIILNSSCSNLFDGYTGLLEIDLSGVDTSNVTSFHSAFRDCSSIENLDLSNFDTKKATDMYEMFSGCSSLKNIELSSFNTANVSNMYAMFDGCSSLTSVNLSAFHTEKVSNMSKMFNGCSSLTDLDLASFRTGNLSGLKAMFNPKIPVFTSASYKVRDGLSELGTATRPYHVFDGWYSDTEFTNAVTNIPAGTHKDVTLYAKWQHPWDNGVVTKEATTTHPGERLYTCTSCGEVKREEIPILKPTSVASVPKSMDLPIVHAPEQTSTQEKQITLEKAKIKTIVAANKKLTVNIEKVADASGYQLQISQSKKFKSKNTRTITVNENSKKARTVSLAKGKKKNKTVKLKNGTRYYVRVRAMKTVKNGGNTIKIYGQWSTVKSKKPHKYKKKVTKTIYY